MWALWPVGRTAAVEVSSARAEEAEVRPCGQCLLCVAACPAGALEYHDRKWRVNLSRCIFCRSCAEVCPNHLISPGAE